MLDHNARGRYSMETVTASEGDTMKSILTITTVAKSDEDVYLCMMENPFGSDEKEIALIVQEPPPPPRDLRASQISSTSAMLLFVSPDAFSSSSSPSSSVLFKRRGFPEQSLLPVTNFIAEVAPLNGELDQSRTTSIWEAVILPTYRLFNPCQAGLVCRHKCTFELLFVEGDLDLSLFLPFDLRRKQMRLPEIGK